MPGPLTSLRVVDVSIMAAGPWIGALLGELGAEVVKVEPPAGDGTRWVEPLQHGIGTNYLCLNVNKRGVTADLKDPGDREKILDLVSSADIFIQNFRGGVIERLGLGYEAVRARNPGIVYCSVSGFGETGPLGKEACADFIMQAYSGFARLNGQRGDSLEAFRFTGFIDLTTSIVATEGVLAALVARQQTGLGQKLEVSMLQAALEMQFTRLAELLGSGVTPKPLGSESPGLVPDRAYQALDGEVFVTVQTPLEWQGFCTAIEDVALSSDPRFASNALRVANRDALNAIIEPIIKARPMIWWMRAFERAGVACALEQHFEQLRYNSQVRENGMIAELLTPKWGEVTVGGLPWHFSRTPGEVHPAPVPGGDTDAVLTSPNIARPTHTAASDKDRTSTDPVLRGLRVVEAASGVAGPMAGRRLADLGADVIKVESGSGDWMRSCPPFLAESDMSAAYFGLNRGKRAVHLDEANGSRLFRRLVEQADVFITDLSASDLKAWGLAGVNADICAWNPKLIVAQISGLGAKGPLAGKACSELCAQAMAGYTRYVGDSDEPAARLGADVAGTSTGIFATQAILAALFARHDSGQGQRIDLSLLNSLIAMKTVHLAAQSDPDAYEGPRVGGAYDPPERGWATADAPITFALGGAVGAEGRPGWTQFVEAVGLSWMLSDDRFDKTGRMTTGLGAKARQFKTDYESEFRKRSSREIVAAVRKVGGFASAYLTHEELLSEPQVEALNIIRNVNTGSGTARVLGFPLRFTDRPVSPTDGGAAALGEHTAEVAREYGVSTAAKDQGRALPEGKAPPSASRSTKPVRKNQETRKIV